MREEFAARVAGIGALAEPARRALYEYVVAQDDAVSREAAATGIGVPVHTAKFHLDRLVEEGLLEVEFRRLTGRTGRGAGRPAKLYRRSAREVSVSLPERRYDLAGAILAAAVERAIDAGTEVAAAVREVAAERGRDVGSGAPSVGDPTVEEVGEVLAAQGYEPRPRDGGLALANCPFDSLAREHTALVCSLNEAYLEGVLDGLGCSSLRAVLDPEPGWCCVKARPVR